MENINIERQHYFQLKNEIYYKSDPEDEPELFCTCTDSNTALDLTELINENWGFRPFVPEFQNFNGKLIDIFLPEAPVLFYQKATIMNVEGDGRCIIFQNENGDFIKIFIHKDKVLKNFGQRILTNVTLAIIGGDR